MPETPEQQSARIAKKIAAQVERGRGRGLNAGRLFLEGRVKEALSVPAPRRLVRPKFGGMPYYVATTRAIPGAPPRKLSGRLRSSLTSAMVSSSEAVIGANARSDRGFNYPKHHEIKRSMLSGEHPFIYPTAVRYQREIGIIVGVEITIEVRR